MVLEQDKPQASQAQAVLDEQQYQKDLAQYNQDLEKYNKEKEEYDKQQKKIADAKAAEEARIAEEKRKKKEKADKRAAEFAAVEKTYQEKLSNNPFTDANRKIESAKHSGRHFNALKFNYQWGQQHQNYNKRAKEAKIESERNLRYQHLAADGKKLTSVAYNSGMNWKEYDRQKFYLKDARQLSNNYGNWKIQTARENYLRGMYGWETYQQVVSGGVKAVKQAQQQQADAAMAKSKAKLAGALVADAQHWQSVASGNYDAKYPTEQKPTLHPAQRTDDLTILNDLKESGIKLDSPETKVETKDHGYYTETILSSINTAAAKTKNNSQQIAKYVTVSDQTFKVPETPTNPIIPVRTNTSSRKGVNEANILQKQYVQDLRDGKISLYQALTKPRTPQMISKNNTINLNQYLTERGYDVTKPETIPDSVLMDRVKYDAARKQASDPSKPMGDLRKLVPSQPQVSDNVIQQRNKTMEKYAVDKGGSFIGYGPDGTPVQGAPFMKQQFQVTTADGKVRTFNSLEHAEKFSQRMTTTQYEVSYSEPTLIPTLTGSVTLQEQVTKTFDSKEEAQSFLDKRQASLPYTQDAKILPLEQMYSGYDQFVKESIQKAKAHEGKESSWIYEGGAAWASFGGDMLNLATMGGDLLDKYVLDRPTIPKQPITTIPTYYDKGTEKALEGIEITETGITGVPSFNPLDKNNIASKWYQGAVKQWEKQTTAQNIGQSTVAIPLAIVDVVSAGQFGTSIVRKLGPSITKVATKIASTPRIVTKVVEASVSVKPNIKNPSYANYNINSLANPDRIDLNLKGVDYMDSPKPPGINLQSKAFTEDLADKGIKPANLVKLDPEYVQDPKINLNLKDSPDYMESPAKKLDLQDMMKRGIIEKPPNKPVKLVKLDEGYKVAGDPLRRRGASEIDYTDSIDGFGNRVKDVSGAKYISPKPTLNLRVGTFKKQVVKMGEQIGTIERNPINIGGRNVYGFTKQSVSLPKSAITKTKKGERFDKPNYDLGASEFADFQKSLEPKLPQRYSNIVGTIKFSEGFVPGKPTRQYKPFKPKEVEVDSGYKADGKVGNILSDTVSTSPLTVRSTKPDKIARLPKTGQAPITKTPRYADIDSPKTPKTGNAPIGYITPKSKPRPKASSFTNMKSTAKKINLPKPDDTPKPKETSQILMPPVVKPKIKKKSTPAPLDPIIDASADTPIPTGTASSNAPIVPPVLSYKEEQKKIKPKKATSQSSIISGVTGQVVQPKVQQKIVSGIVTKQTVRSRQTPRAATKISQTPIVVQSAPQKIAPAIKQSLRSSPRPRPRLRSKPKFRFRARVRPIQSQPDPIPGRARTVIGFAPPSEKKSEKKKELKKKKRKEFLGNTRLDKIEGLFRRSEIISGDKRVAKQEKLDKAFKENKKKTRKKKPKQSFSQKMGIVSKGFKI